MVVRILAGLGVAGLLVWLGVDAYVGRIDVRTVEGGLRSGAFGGLDPAEESRLGDLATALLPDDRRFPRRIVVNKVATDTLGIITFTESARRIHGFGMLRPGNAVYNAELDTIFLDRDFVREALGETSPLLRELRFYFSLLLLHEFGHRERHAASGGFFEANSAQSQKSLRLEIEADDYALNRLRAVYRADLSVGGTSFFGTNWNSAIVYGIPDAPANEFWRGLFSTAHLLPLYYFVRGGDFSAVYANEAHPTLIARLRRLIADAKTAAKSEGDRRLIEAHRAFLSNVLDQSEEMRRSVVCEVKSEGQLVGATWSKDGLILLDRAGNLSTVSYGALDATSRNTSYCVITPADRRGSMNWPLSTQEAATALFVQLGDGPVVATEDGRVYRATERRWQLLASLPRLVTAPRFAGPRVQLHTSAARGRRRTLAIGTEDGVAVLTSSGRIAVLSRKAATEEVCQRLGLVDCSVDFELSGVGDGRVVMSFGRIAGPMGEDVVGVGEFRLSEEGRVELDAIATKPLPPMEVLPKFHVTVSPDGATVWAHGTDGKPRIISHPPSGRPLSAPYGWAVWRLSDKVRAVKVASHRYTAELIPLAADGSLMRDYDPVFRGAIWLGPGKIGFDYGYMDPLYLVDVETGSVAVPSPSPDYLEAAPDRPWFAAVVGIGEGTHRVYVLRMGEGG